MGDPFLDAHRVLKRLYAISGGISPANIRDQMVRGRMIVDRLCVERLCAPGRRGRPLMIVGAGVAGTTAAMRAAELRIRTQLVERADAPYRVQAGGRDRWIDPTLYDWPVDHWRNGTYQRPSDTASLECSAGTAAEWAGKWEAYFKNFCDLNNDILKVMYKCEAIGLRRVSEDVIKVRLRDLETKLEAEEDAAAVIWAAGQGQEVSELRVRGADDLTMPLYRSRPFWSANPFLENRSGLNAVRPGAAPDVLIIGAGDGGLQDLLRIVAKCTTPAEIYAACKIPAGIERRIFSIEDRATRFLQWLDPDKTEHRSVLHRVLLELHTSYLQEAARAIGCRQVREGLASVIPDSPDRVRLVYKCEHFGATVYPLNRFLVLLIDQFLRQERGINDLLLPRRRLAFVRPDDGRDCLQSPIGSCDGLPHTVHLRPQPSCCKNPAGDLEKLSANMIVVRFGAEDAPVPPVPERSKRYLELSRARHMLPYLVLTD